MKTITVKGIGSASVKPDLVEVTMELRTCLETYGESMCRANEKIDWLAEALEELGFAKDELKTRRFDVCADYESVRDHNGNYHRVFKGYEVEHRLALSFDFDTKLLTQVLGAVAVSKVAPELSIAFRVKDPAAVNEALLASAAENARRKAEVLCAAAGAALGELVNISYHWGEVEFVSNLHYAADDECLGRMADCAAPDIEPEEIKASDTVTFVWEII